MTEESPNIRIYYPQVDALRFFASVLLLGGSLYLIPQLAPDPNGFYYDANGYVRNGRTISESGLWGGYAGQQLRTYLYPYLLSLHPAVRHEDPVLMASYAKSILIPFAAVAICTWLLLKATAVRNYFLMWAAILINPLLLQYVPITLTESGLLLMFSLLCGFFASYARPAPNTAVPSIRHASLVIVLGVLAGALPVIRPAGLSVSIATFLAVLHVTARNQARPRSLVAAARSVYNFATIALLFGIGFFVAVFPQIVLNLKHFDQFTFFPVDNLDSKQFYWGLENFKYATHPAPGVKTASAYYPAAGLVGNVATYQDAPLTYYRDHVVPGLLLLLAHFYQSVNYDFLHVYVTVNDYAILSWHQLLSSLITVLGLFGVGYALRRFRREILDDPVQAFLLLVLCFVSALNSVTAVETRFGMLATAVLSYFALRFSLHVVPALNRRQNFAVAISVFAYLGLSAWASKEFVETTGAFSIVWI